MFELSPNFGICGKSLCTRMHSSRMRTDRRIDRILACPGVWWCVWPGGWCVWACRVCLARGWCVWLVWLEPAPRRQTSRQTPRRQTRSQKPPTPLGADPPVNRMTDTCKNITFAALLSNAVGKNGRYGR